MHSFSRRGFLARSAVAALGLTGASLLTSPANAASRSIGPFTQVCVIVGDALGDATPRTRSWIYIREVLARAGVFYRKSKATEIESLVQRGASVIVLAGNLSLNVRQREALAEWVKRGGMLLGLAGCSGMFEVFGATSEAPLAEAWIKPGATHRVTDGLRSSLHVFGGHTLIPSTARIVAGIEGGSAYVKGNAILENRFGKGCALVVGPDLIFSIVHIQQGVPVLQDSKPANDGSAMVNDGVLKAEDGFVLDWTRDRSAVEPEGKIFLEPVTDELRELLLRCLLHLAVEGGRVLPILWQWPRSLKAIASMSHDSDGNDPSKAVALLDVVNANQIRTTWCILYPGGYPREFYARLLEHQCEVALHYDAMSGAKDTSWSRHNFLRQAQWLMDEAGVREITTNKNHYTRWEGRCELWRWCEEAGIRSDQTRGPSKRGSIGFPLGGAQPYFPLDDESREPRFFNVLEVNLLAQDLVITCPAEYGRQLMDSALRHNGVGHFLFHPAHIQKPGVAEALKNLVNYAREAGMEWWTNRQIFEWENLRRSVRTTLSEGELLLRASEPVSSATLLFLRPGNITGQVQARDQTPSMHKWKLHGFEFDACDLSLRRETRLQWHGV